MNQREEHLGLAQAMLERLNKQRLPWLLELKQRVDAGERLTDFEIDRLQEALRDAQENEGVVATLVDEFPDLAGLRSRVVDLYHSITSKALENEERASDGA